jgi:hypothetical protein
MALREFDGSAVGNGGGRKEPRTLVTVQGSLALWLVGSAKVCGGEGWVVGVGECLAEGFDGLMLKTEPDVGVDLGGDGDVGVAEEFLDRDQLDALLQ